MSAGARVAICIPVADDPHGLRDTLRSVAALADEADGVTVVVAVDGADAATVAVATELGARAVPLAERAGSYVARNAAVDALPDGIEAVLFTDAGCLVRRGWVREHVEALRRHDMSGGAVDVTMSLRPTPAEWVDAQRNLRQQAYVDNDGFAATANLAVRRELLDVVRFDPRLRSGGDRDFCLRARASGATLTYTAGAVVEHPARTTARAVLAKARRVGNGLAELPRASRPQQLPNRRPGLALARRARAAGRGGPVWWARVALLDALRARAVHRAASRAAIDLHVTVLLGSRWDALETFSTRWREVVRVWAADDRIGALTVVDHPTLGRRALLRRQLVVRAPSWLAGVDRLRLTIPVNADDHLTDRIATWRAARALRRAFPPARRHLVVAATPLSATLLPLLEAATTTTAFDVVDIWNVRRQFADLHLRLDQGYRAGARADAVTAVARSLADEVARLGANDPVVVMNGVDASALRSASVPAHLDLPDGPFAVYVGNVGGRIDLDLLEKAAAAGDAPPVVVAGPAADADTEARLRSGPVRWLGQVDADDVPGLLRAAACGLLPYRDTGLFDALDSMKLLQYLAAGLPVVSTPLPAAPEGVRTAADAESFATAMRAAVEAPRCPPAVDVPDWSAVAATLLDHYLASPAR